IGWRIRSLSQPWKKPITSAAATAKFAIRSPATTSSSRRIIERDSVATGPRIGVPRPAYTELDMNASASWSAPRGLCFRRHYPRRTLIQPPSCAGRPPSGPGITTAAPAPPWAAHRPPLPRARVGPYLGSLNRMSRRAPLADPERLRAAAAEIGAGEPARHIFLCVDPEKARCCPRDVGRASWEHLKRRLKRLGHPAHVIHRSKAGCLR